MVASQNILSWINIEWLISNDLIFVTSRTYPWPYLLWCFSEGDSGSSSCGCLSILVAASSKKVMSSMEKSDLNCVFELYLWSYNDDLDILISLQDYTKLLGCLDTFCSLGSNLNYLNFTQWESPSSIYMKIPTASSPLIPIPFLLIIFIWSRIKNLRWWYCPFFVDVWQVIWIIF